MDFRQKGFDSSYTLITVVVGIISILTFTVDIPQKIAKLFTSKESIEVFEQPLAETIYDVHGNPLKEIQVFLPEFSRVTETNSFGRFEFRIEMKAQHVTELIAQKNGFVTQNRYATLGNENLNFQMKKVDDE